MKLSDLTITGNSGLGAEGYAVLAKRVTVTNNGSVNDASFDLTGGLHAVRKLLAKDCLIENNLNFGIGTTVLVLGRSTVTNNGTNPDCAANIYATSIGCADLAIANGNHRPIVSGTSTCGTSARLHTFAGDTWGVCAND